MKNLVMIYYFFNFQLGSFNVECTKFYTAEIIASIEYLHGIGIIHR